MRQETLPLDIPGDGFADLIPAGQLRELDPAERVAAELDILGFEVSQHVLDFYTDLLDGLGVVRSERLPRCRGGSIVLVAGVKVATQTPAIRSGRRIIFVSLDDAVGLVDLAFFESVPDRCVATLAGSWLLLVRGRVRVVSASAATVNALDCWDLAGLETIRANQGISAVRATLTQSPLNQPAPNQPAPNQPAPNQPAPSQSPGQPADPPPRDVGPSAPSLVYPTGFTLSPYAETGTPGPPIKSRRR